MTHSPQTPNKRPYRTVLGLCGLLALLACQPQQAQSGPPFPPYGADINVLQTPSHVEFEFQTKEQRFHDLVLEVYKKDHQENRPDNVRDISNAHFYIRLDQLDALGQVVHTWLDKEVQGSFQGRSFGMSTNDLRLGSKKSSKQYWLEAFRLAEIDNFSYIKYPHSERHRLVPWVYDLPPGRYRLRVDALAPLPQMDGRLVQVTVEPSRTKY